MSTFNATLPITMPVYISKLGVSKDVNISKSLNALIANGLKQKVNDSHADVKRPEFKTDAEFVAAVNKEVNATIEKIESGNWAARGAPPAITDEIMADMLGISVEEVRAMKAKKANGSNGAAEAVVAMVPESVLVPKEEKKSGKSR
jgi:hypothetical protein